MMAPLLRRLLLPALMSPLLTCAAQAQQSGPLSLMPDAADLWGESTTDATEDPTGNAATGTAPGIAMQSLERLSSDSVGLLTRAQGGFGPALWQGSAPRTVDLLLEQLPTNLKSNAVRTLALRLLLSTAPPPTEQAPADQGRTDHGYAGRIPAGFPAAPDAEMEENTAPRASLLEARVARLIDLGAWDSVDRLLASVPTADRTDALSRARIELLLSRGENDVACAETLDGLRRFSSPFWLKADGYCKLLDGNIDGARFALDLLREMGADDPAYFWAAALIAGEQPFTPNGLERLSPLHLAMLDLADRLPPDTMIEEGHPTVLGAVARRYLLDMMERHKPTQTPDATQANAEAVQAADDTSAEPEDTEPQGISENEAAQLALEAARLTLIERAVAAGAANVEGLREAYRLLALPEGDRPALPDLSVADPRHRATLFTLAETQDLPTARAEIMALLFRALRAGTTGSAPDIITTARIYAPLLTGLSPQPELVWFGGVAVRGLLAAGEEDAARDWIALVGQSAWTGIEADRQMTDLWPILHFLGPDTRAATPVQPIGPADTTMPFATPPVVAVAQPRTSPTWGRTLTDWMAAVPPDRIKDEAQVLNLLDALGEPLETTDWLGQFDREASRRVREPATHIRLALNSAARGQRIGETILLALIALDGNGPANVSSATQNLVISALNTAGLTEEARAFALETALLTGL